MDMELFRDLSRLQKTGNFSQAAAQGNLSQPAFSRRIKSLEAWVGVELVDRSCQPVKLTKAGLQMLEAGLQAVGRIERERSQILELQSLPDKYAVTFGAQHSIGWRFYPAWLQALEDSYGPILSRLRADDLPNCLRDLREGDVDFVIAFDRAEAPQHKAFEAITIGADALVPVCKPAPDGGPLFQFRPQGPQMPYLRFGATAPIARHLEPLFDEYRLSERLNAVYENSMAGALRLRARDGLGVAWLPKSLVAPDLDSGALVRTGAPEWNVSLQIKLIRNQAHANRVTDAIWAHLAARQDRPLLD